MTTEFSTSAFATASHRNGPIATAGAPTPLVLVVDDDFAMRKYLRSVLSDHGFRIVEAATGARALIEAAAHQPDVVLLDLRLPDYDAFRVTTELRVWSETPILILSGTSEPGDQITALNAGANDFLAKPFGAGELIARICVWLRHTRRGAPRPADTVIEVGDLRLDLATRAATVKGRAVRLTPTQYKIFAVMMRNVGKVLTYEQVLEAVWGAAYKTEFQCLRVHMANLRTKFEDSAARPRYFITEPGVGYRLRVSE